MDETTGHWSRGRVVHRFFRSNIDSKVTKMSEEALRTQDRRAFWYIVAICLLPLVPYAIRG